MTRHRAHWGGVYAVSLCLFALVASEFMPVSLLTPITADLRITEGMAGHGITASGTLAVLTSLSLSAWAGRWDRKTLLLALTALMGVSAAIVAMAPNYPTYRAGRALLGIVIGGFWSLSAAVAIRLVPPDQVPKALGIFNGGNALAMVIAAPLGSHLGAVFGWRGAFLALVPVAWLAWVWQWAALPKLPADEHVPDAGRVVKLLQRRTVACGLAGCGAFFMGQFALFTYLRPFLETITQVSVSTLSLLLLGMGVTGFIGTLLMGAMLKRGVHGPLIAAPLLLSLIALALIPLGAWLAPVAVLLGLWGLIATGAPVAWWNWVAQTLPNDAEAGGGWMVAVIQFAIALGATLGGALFDTSGHQGTFVASTMLLWLAALLTFQSARAQATHTT